KPDGGWFPVQRIALEDAVRFFTWNNAYVTFEEDRKGSLKEGKLADVVVLDRDIFTRPPRELVETLVRLSILAGNGVPDSARAARPHTRSAPCPARPPRS